MRNQSEKQRMERTDRIVRRFVARFSDRCRAVRTITPTALPILVG